MRIRQMSFFSWLSGNSPAANGAVTGQAAHAVVGRDPLPLFEPQRLEPESLKNKNQRKNKRHACREPLHEAIQEAMTRSGVVAASYKFKVLSIDPRDKNFLVMIDLTRIAGDTVPQSGEMEALIVQSARVRHDIMVSAVYWRLDDAAAANRAKRPGAAPVFVPARSVRREPAPVLHEPVHEDEVAAFQRALLSACAHGLPVAVEKNAKAGSGLVWHGANSAGKGE